MSKPKWTLGVVGNGFVGQATALFECENIKVLMYDIVPEKCMPVGLTLYELVEQSDFITICVPTPMKSNGECETGIVESCIKQIRECKHYISRTPHIIVRSTVPVGFCKQNRVHHFPEFLTEANWKNDFKRCEHWVIGSHNDNKQFNFEFVTMICDAHKCEVIDCSNASVVDTDTSEFIKYGRNCFLAAKLSICNEYYQFCDKKGINYSTAMRLIGQDGRIGVRYTNVPGPDGKTGWSGTCFPKDTLSFVHQLKQSGADSYMIEAAVNRNTNVDRPSQDWKKESNKGRTFI